MDLTPVRIRGKKRPKPQPPSDTAPKRGPGRPRSGKLIEIPPNVRPSRVRADQPSKWKVALPWPPGGPDLQSQSVQQDEDTQGDTQTPRKRRRKSRGRKLSVLEQLPAEVLQQIFLDSMNIDLPLASPALLHKLNSEHIKMNFTVRALYWPSEQDRTDGTNGLPEMQGRLLSRRFFTWDFYRRYARKALELYGSWPWLEAQESGPSMEQVLRDDDFREMDHFVLRADRVEEIDPFLRFHNKTAMPEKLLKGPWDEDKHLFFRFLFVQEFQLDHEASTSAETLIESLTGLARSGANFEIAQWLVCIAITENIPLPQNLLRRAVIDGGCHEELVDNLLTWSLHGEIEYFDPVLWNWAEVNGEKGKWLQDKLRTTSDEKDAWNAGAPLTQT